MDQLDNRVPLQVIQMIERDVGIKPPRDSYYNPRYSIPVLGWDEKERLIWSLLRWDYKEGGWVEAGLREGRGPYDYSLEVSVWDYPPDKPRPDIIDS